MQGSDFACRELVQMNTLARKLVRDTGASIPDNAFVFLMHQGYQFLYFLVGEESDPQVHLFDDGGTLKPIGLTFADWFLRTTDEEIEIWRGLKD